MASRHEPKQTEFFVSCPWCGTKIHDNYELENHWMTCRRDPLRTLHKRADATARRMEVENDHFRDVLLAIKQGKMPCVKCRYMDRCQSALDVYNIGTEAKVNCLEAT
jgi:hypothetical protein